MGALIQYPIPCCSPPSAPLHSPSSFSPQSSLSFPCSERQCGWKAVPAGTVRHSWPGTLSFLSRTRSHMHPDLSPPHVLQRPSNRPTGSTLSPDATLQQVMASAGGFTVRVCCSMDSDGSEGLSILLLCGEQGSYVQ